MEHVILNRLTRYVEQNDILPYKIACRPGLSTQDAMLLIKHQLILVRPVHARAALGLDIEKAFDRTEHEANVKLLPVVGLGERLFGVVIGFLGGRQASLALGELKSEVMNLGNRGTTQGAMLSPMLFNLAMTRAARKLERVEVIHFAIYADDITIWCANGNVGQTET